MTVRTHVKTQGRIDRRPASPKPWRLRGFAAAAVVAAVLAAGLTFVGAGNSTPEPLPATTPGPSDADSALASRFADRGTASHHSALSDADRALANRFADRKTAGNDASLSDADRALRDRFTGR